MAKQNADALIAAFLAKGGAITKVPEGEQALNLSPREWRLQTQMVKADYLDKGYDAEAERRAERRAELAHDFAFVGDREAAYAARAGEFDR
ncbi:hypothetical protein EV128_12573 [Rhizobium azibense]|nr:hypothetical protein EV128_12573 [Rhizobium azibense]